MTGMASNTEQFPRVGMIGAGQLARMTHRAAIDLGVEFAVLGASRLESAGRVVHHLVEGSHDARDDVIEFGEGCDVVTFDHEHVPLDILEELVSRGVSVQPQPAALAHAQDKLLMRRRLSQAGIPCPPWREVASAEEVSEFAGDHGWPVVLKTSRGGYDGRGVWVVDDASEAASVIGATPLAPGTGWLAEQRVEFQRELAAQVARSPHGQAVAYPVVHTVQAGGTQGGMCSEVIAPAPDLAPERAVEAQRIALDVAKELDVTGMLAVELFDTGDALLVNELAMRPHNSGHWSIEGSTTSQFENHLRAVLDLPLGSPELRAPWTVMANVIGTDRGGLYAALRHVMAHDPSVKVHLYGKDVRPDRKLGHVTVMGHDLADVRARAKHAADYLSGVIDE